LYSSLLFGSIFAVVFAIALVIVLIFVFRKSNQSADEKKP
jgi:flagellar biogenesis protein FliO